MRLRIPKKTDSVCGNENSGVLHFKLIWYRGVFTEIVLTTPVALSIELELSQSWRSIELPSAILKMPGVKRVHDYHANSTIRPVAEAIVDCGSSNSKDAFALVASSRRKKETHNTSARVVNAWIEPEDEKAVSDKKNGKKVLCQKWKGLNVYAPADDEYAEILGTIVDFEWRGNSNPMTWVSVVDVEEDETEPVYVSELPDMVLAAKQRDDILLIAGESDDEIGTEFSGDVSEESSDDESE